MCLSEMHRVLEHGPHGNGHVCAPTTATLEKKTAEELLVATERPVSAIRFTHSAVGTLTTYTRLTGLTLHSKLSLLCSGLVLTQMHLIGVHLQ